jgi:hypothetical protein
MSRPTSPSWHSKLTVVYVMAVAGIVGVVLQHTVV